MTEQARGGYQGAGGYQADGPATQTTACDECAALVAPDRRQVHEEWHRALAARLPGTRATGGYQAGD